MADQPKQPTANELLFDQAIRRQIALRRYSAGEVQRAAALLSDSEKGLIAALIAGLDGITSGRRPLPGSYTAKRLETLLDEIVTMRTDAWASVRADVTAGLRELAKEEAVNEVYTIDDAVPIRLDVVTPPVAKVIAAAVKSPFQGQLLQEWYRKLESADRARITAAVRRGVIEGRKVDEIVREIRGSRINAFQDGALSATRRDLEAVVSTAVSAVSNGAREVVWEANADILDGLRWTATLDGRTSAVCRARDGTIYEVGKGPRPPAHYRCRSVMVPVLKGSGVVGTRPTVTDTRTREEREIDFRKQAKAKGTSVQAARDAWAKANVGSAPAETTYDAFLRRQPAAFQDDVLGKTKGKLFRQGGLDLGAFVDRAGNELTLDELRKVRPDAWKKAFGD